jgi:hypothetical protein
VKSQPRLADDGRGVPDVAARHNDEPAIIIGMASRRNPIVGKSGGDHADLFDEHRDGLFGLRGAWLEGVGRPELLFRLSRGVVDGSGEWVKNQVHAGEEDRGPDRNFSAGAGSGRERECERGPGPRPCGRHVG